MGRGEKRALAVCKRQKTVGLIKPCENNKDLYFFSENYTVIFKRKSVS